MPGQGLPLPPSRLNPYPLIITKFARRAMRHPWTVCIIGICLGIFPTENPRAAELDISLRSAIRWLQHHKQGQEGKSKEGLGPLESSGESGQLPGMLAFCAWCSHLLSSAVAHRMCNAAFYMCCWVCVLWAVVSPGAPCMGVRTLRACPLDVRTSSMLDLKQPG